jgi:hypothetical protein
MQRGDLGGESISTGREAARPIRDIYSKQRRFVDLV